MNYVQQFIVGACEGFCLAMALILFVVFALILWVNINLVVLLFVIGSLCLMALMGAGMKWE